MDDVCQSPPGGHSRPKPSKALTAVHVYPLDNPASVLWGIGVTHQGDVAIFAAVALELRKGP
jgi:hypothetical protein